YLACLADYERAARRGADLFEDYDELIEGLNRESEDVQATVRSRSIYARAATTLPPDVADERGAAQHPHARQGDAASADASIAMPELKHVTAARIQPKRRPSSRRVRTLMAE